MVFDFKIEERVFSKITYNKANHQNDQIDERLAEAKIEELLRITPVPHAGAFVFADVSCD